MDDGAKDQSGFARATTTAMSEMTLLHGQEAAQVNAMPQAEMSHNQGQGMGYMQHMDKPCQDPGAGAA